MTWAKQTNLERVRSFRAVEHVIEAAYITTLTPTLPNLSFGTGSFSIEAWMLHKDYTYPLALAPISKQGPTWNADPGWGTGQGFSETGLPFFICDGANLVVANIPLAAGVTSTSLKDAYHHFVVVVDRVAGRALLYLDGVLQSSGLDISGVPGSVDSTGYFTAGNSVGWRFRGLLDEIRLYHRALSSLEAQEHYNGVYRNESGLRLRWKLEEGSGDIVSDSSGFGHTGQAVAAVWSNNVPTIGYRRGTSMTGVYSEQGAVNASWDKEASL